MTERCKSNPCCGDYFNCKRPPQFLPREGYEAYQRRIGNAPREASMAGEMPDRIWVTPLGEPDGGFWYSPCTDKSDKTEYVLASTHQRALEALREAEKALAEIVYALCPDGQSFAVGEDAQDALRIANAALAKRDEEVARLMTAAYRDALVKVIRAELVHEKRLRLSYERKLAALTKEPTNAG